MKLFLCADAEPVSVPAITAIQTPLGKVYFKALVEGAEITGETPSETQRLPSGGFIACWHREEFDLELLCHPSRPLVSRADVTDCWAAIWRLQAHASSVSCIFTAAWETGYRWHEGGPDSGQWLYARSYDDGQGQVSIGTYDGDLLARLAHQGEGLPTEWEPYFQSTPNQFDWFLLQPIHYELGDNGLAVPLPPLGTGKLCQIPFVLAWASVENNGAVLDAVERALSKSAVSAGCS